MTFALEARDSGRTHQARSEPRSTLILPILALVLYSCLATLALERPMADGSGEADSSPTFIAP